MLARILVYVYLLCGVGVLGASLSNNSSVVDEGISNSTSLTNSSTFIRPKFISILRLSSNHTVNKTQPEELKSNKTSTLKIRDVEVFLKNLTSANMTYDDVATSTNFSSNSIKTRQVSKDNSTRNATTTERSSANKTSSSLLVERSFNMSANGTSMDNSTKAISTLDDTFPERNSSENIKKNETEKVEESGSLLEKTGIRILRRREANNTDDESDQAGEDVKQADNVLEDSSSDNDGADLLDDVSAPNDE